MAFKVLASSGFDKEIIMVDYLPKTPFGEAHLQVLLKGGFLGTKLKFLKKDIQEMEVIDEKEVSSDGAQRLKNAAIGTFLLGPIGLIGAAIGGAKSTLRLRVGLNQGQQLLLEVKSDQCVKLLKELASLNLDQLQNESLLKK